MSEEIKHYDWSPSRIVQDDSGDYVRYDDIKHLLENRATASDGVWLPIESAPRDASCIDIWCEPTDPRWAPCRIADCWFVYGQWHCTDQWGEPAPLPHWATPTHWMPLPKPPITRAEDELKGGKV